MSEDGVPASGSLDAIGDDINTTGEVGSSDLERSDSIGDGDGSGTGNGVLDREDRANDDLDGNKPQNLFIKRTVSEDFANNNNGTRRLSSEDNDVEEDMDTSNRGQFGRDVDDPDDESNSKMDYPSLLNMNSISKIPSMLPFSNSSKLESSSVTEHLKEQLQTISMTISQLSSTMTNNSSPKNVQELAVLQATLFSLQQQQLLQMQILSQIQQQQSDRQDSPPSSMPSIAELAKKMERQNSLDQERPKELSALSSLSSSMPLPPSMPAKSNVLTGSGITPTTTQSSGCSKNAKSMHHTSASISSQVLDPNAPPPSLASSIIMHGDSPDDDKPAVNSLELLQKRAQGILNNASQGLLANNLADFSVNRDKEFDKKEPFFKHRCRYCGKVFGSDSALQIHVRSHTGERPYKCNICGNRFTTKGNLKVHFQRHSSKFPHIKMNPNLVPEHLDKFYPPLLQQIEDAEKKGLPIPNVNNPMAGMTPIIPPGMTLPALPNSIPGYPSFSPPPPGLSGSSNGMPRFPMPTSTAAAAAAAAASVSLSLPAPNLPTEPLKREDVPENLARSTPRSRSISPISSRAESRRSPRPMGLEDLKEAIALNRARVHHERSISPHEEKPSPEDMDDQEEPENLTKARTRSVSPPRMDHSPSFPHDRHADSSPANIMPYKTSPSLPMSTASSIIPLPNGPIILPPSVDPAKDPNVYTNLLPRPGSNDNAWESLIEVAKTSETSKLEQLVNNIEHKLSDPNECVICHRVLSCKSALQMHYRTHTGERPFKCRICGRAFTTKGNLKTHMGVHRAKPPMRMFHQCPVCHKKYANALVLQQHIKTHTGEPTELTAEQIAAAEIRDFPPLPFAPGSFPGLGSLRLHGSGLFPNLPHGQFPLGPFGSESQSPDIMDKDDIATRGNTTCQICFKVFACHSALEIHIRSHTKERPFKCHVCDRGFSTKGNMKQHALTHKTNKDGEILNVSSPINSSLGPNSSSSPPNSPYPSSSPNHGLSSSSLTTPTNSNSTSTSTTSASSNKHNCQVCKKPFSSGSALQIHMRTHTGDRPFKCSVCGKAFTTKGNLKVHMGTHMWSNSNQTSRRGRRMSLEMSHPPIPMNAKDSEFLHRRRPELFFPPPFLPTQFDTNGILPPSTQALQRSLLAEFHNHHQNGTSEDTSEVSRSLAAQPLPPSVRSMSHNHVDDESSPEPIRIRSPHSLHLSPKRKASPSTSQQDPSEENGDRRYSHEPWNWKLSKGDREGRRLIMPTKSDSKLSDRTNSQDEPGVAEDLVTAPAKEDDNDEELEEEGLEEEEEEEEDEEEDSKDVSPCPKSPLPSVPEKIHTSPPTATEIC
eukprot:TCALIF_02138-PA protein Name:"Similar to salm Homeotic protein spalt-major (Drosophila melanogaster)" AED:0.11 eAED:0.12 QI:0/0.5/0.28/0.85/0.66/0.57/7/1248/1329